MNPTAAELLPEAHVGVEAKVVAVSAVLVGVVIPVANQTLQQGQAQKTCINRTAQKKDQKN